MTDAYFGVAGLSQTGNIEAARFGIAGLNDKHIITSGQQAAGIGVAGLDTSGLSSARCAIAGVNTNQIVSASKRAAGLDEAAGLYDRDNGLAAVTRQSQRLGDRATRQSWRRGVWFADFTYVTTPYHENDTGGYIRNGHMRWRDGRDLVFGRSYRSLPMFIDSCGYRRELSGTAPKWAKDFVFYPQAIELIDPDGYAAWDYPTDRGRSLAALRELMTLFPADVASGRLWPVFSVRWTWDDNAHLSLSRLPGWASRNLGSMIPTNRTQKPFAPDTRERWVRQTIANALVMAVDPDFRWILETFGRVMIGGLVGSACPRMARHILAAVLCELFPGVQFWLLGQANFAVVNGLGMLGLLNQVWSDGTWWVKDATAERFAYVEDGLITMHSFESGRPGRGDQRWHRETFFTLIEMMAANLRSLLSAYEGLWSWPPPEPLPVDLLDIGQAIELKRRYQMAQLELGL